MIIGVSGKIGTGKSTFCEYLKEYLDSGALPGWEPPRTKIIAFADALKEEAATLYGFPLEFAYKRKDFLCTISRELVADKFINPAWDSHVSIRDILQWLGSDVMRKENPDYWIEKLAKEIDRLKMPQNGGYRLFLIPDVRFPNELAFVQGNGICVRLQPYVGYHYQKPEHESETVLDGASFDKVLNPTYGNLQPYAEALGKLVESLYGR